MKSMPFPLHRLWPGLLILLLGSCAQLPPHNPMASWIPSANHEPRRAQIIVIHATEQDSVRESLNTLRSRNGQGPVSSHYLIGRDGHIYQLVADERRAWHAGAGRWGTINDLNSASIGIELDNDGQAAFPPAQIKSLLRLLDDLCNRLRIPRHQIIAHADMAPTRKRDPNVHFPWQQLADVGFGSWPRVDAPPAPEGFDPWLALAAFGYPLDDPEATLRAFHRRFRGLEGDYPLDAEDARILYDLTRALRPPAPQ